MLSPEDKQLIAEYMGWNLNPIVESSCTNFIISYSKKEPYNFDLNDAGLCVEKMVLNDQWGDCFYTGMKLYKDVYCNELWNKVSEPTFAAWFFNPDNFFSAMAEWLRSK